MGAEISPVYAPAFSAWTFWAPVATVDAARASRTSARTKLGGHSTRSTPGASVAAAIATASWPASPGVAFIFQLPATITGRTPVIIGRVRRCSPGPPRARAGQGTAAPAIDLLRAAA